MMHAFHKLFGAAILAGLVLGWWAGTLLAEALQ